MNNNISQNQDVRKSRRWRAIMFYSLLAVVVLGLLVLIRCAMNPLNKWLEQYENSQYQNTADEIYELLFAEPDWALLYNMAGIEDTQFEGQSQFAAYMEQTVGNDTLSCVEVPTGLSDQRRFSIRHADTEIAGFTMTPTDGGWTLGTVELFFTRSQSVTVTTAPGQTVYINKIPLDDSYTTLSVSTAAEEYLPEDVHGYRYQQQTVEDLLMPPEITVLDTYGRVVELIRDGENCYRTEIPTSDPMTDEEYTRILEAAMAEALFFLRQISISQLRQYFDSASPAYNDLVGTDAAITVTSWSLDEASIRIFDFYRYSEDLFSVHVQLTLNITDDTGAAHTRTTDVSYFFQPNNAGTYMVTERFTADLQQQIHSVRLRFFRDGLLPEIVMADANAGVYTLPASENVAAWGVLSSNGTLIPVLVRQADGTFRLSDGQQLTPMDLYPITEE